MAARSTAATTEYSDILACDGSGGSQEVLEQLKLVLASTSAPRRAGTAAVRSPELEVPNRSRARSKQHSSKRSKHHESSAAYCSWSRLSGRLEKLVAIRATKNKNKNSSQRYLYHYLLFDNLKLVHKSNTHLAQFDMRCILLRGRSSRFSHRSLRLRPQPGTYLFAARVRFNTSRNLTQQLQLHNIDERNLQFKSSTNLANVSISCKRNLVQRFISK